MSNGPFLLKKWTPGYEILLQKNPTYWDAKHVYLKGIRIQIIPETMTQCDLYQKRQVDYIGSPLSLFFDPDLLLKHPLKNELKTKETATVFCLMVNTEKKVLANPSFRRALSLALNRREIAEELLSKTATAATGFLAGRLSVTQKPTLNEVSNPSKAKQMLVQALKELELTKKELPKITLHYRSLANAEKVMLTVQSQWKNVLGLETTLIKNDYPAHMDTLGRGQYEIGESFWCSKVADPSYVLSFFLQKNQWTNFPNWESSDYQKLLAKITHEAQKENRIQLIQQAEEVFLHDMPLIPVYFTRGLWLQNPKLQGLIVTDLGQVDFKGTYFD